MSRILAGLTRLLRLSQLHALVTIPGFIALSIWSLAFLALWLEDLLPDGLTDWLAFLHVDIDTTRTVLSTIASAAITTMGLVYSIVLLVFTTAASNIGPRLLQRFTGDRINQMTAGLLGGTFLYALTVLHQTVKADGPRLALGIAFVLIVLCVIQLIRFVGAAATSVTVDEEVAEISDQLSGEIDRIVRQEDEASGREGGDEDVRKIPTYGGADECWLRTGAAGYITKVDEDRIVALLAERDLSARLLHAPGDFVVPGQRLARLERAVEGAQREALEDAFGEAITLAPSRTPQADVGFAINLLIEIALRALSPGVNDTFTAIVCVDRISSALADPVRVGLRGDVRRDAHGEARLIVPGLSIEELINTAFAPLRRAARGNVLMGEAVLRALGRLLEIARAQAREPLETQMRLLVTEAVQRENGTKGPKADMQRLRSVHRDLMRL